MARITTHSFYDALPRSATMHKPRFLDGLAITAKFKIGADATAAAGPVGREAAAAMDLKMHAEILTYSRSRGIFAGIRLEGAVVKPDRKADEALYAKNVNREAIPNGKVLCRNPQKV
ncbi:MAG TPA: lipid-binding SYLF domain-containing protein [Candidatus Dormibacteraeota bacterium]|nr:lipid-binding SYLF domain-containing protein [Candidatus Dormibacteraeota bacterium]